jgi:hypothetical protein
VVSRSIGLVATTHSVPTGIRKREDKILIKLIQIKVGSTNKWHRVQVKLFANLKGKMKKEKDWRTDKRFLGLISFIAVLITSTCYAILSDKAGEDIANLFVDNYAGLYRAIFPSNFAIENPRAMLQAIKFALCLAFNALGLGIAIYAWEPRVRD